VGGRRTDEITVLEVEAVQLVARLLGIHYVFIDNECRSLGVICNSLADLTERSVCCMVLGGAARTELDQTFRRDRRAPLV